MKALSIVSPGGSRIAAGLKTMEVRRWHPHLASRGIYEVELPGDLP